MRPLENVAEKTQALFFNADDGFEPGNFGVSNPLLNESSASPVLFGTSFVEMTPPSKTSLAGFGGIGRRLMPPQLTGADGFFTYCKPYKSIDLSPRIKTLLWTQGSEDAFAIIALDVVAVPADVTRKIISALRNRWPGKTWNQSNVQVVGSHTHSGPAGLTENPFWGIFACDRYSQPLWDFFQSKALEAVDLALKDAQPISTAWLKKENLQDLNKSRFPGMNAHKQSLVFSFAETKEEIAGSDCFATFAIHPTWYGTKSLVLSSDVVGYVEKGMALNNKGTPCLFLNGAVGNADMGPTPSLETYGNKLGGALLDHTPEKWNTHKLTLKYGSLLVELPKATPNLKACKVPPVDFLVSAEILDNLPPRTKLAYLELGETLFLFYPGEPVFTIQEAIEKKIKAKRPDIKNVQILGLSNDYVGYMVDSPDFEKETLESCSTLYGSEISKVMSDGVMKMLKLNPDISL